MKISKEKGIENKEFLGKKLSSDAELIMWLSSDKNKKKEEMHNLKFPFNHMDSKIKDKDFHKLIKIAKQCELFFLHKCKNEYIIKNCSNCSVTYFHNNDLLRFINFEIFLYYMKYLFVVSNDIVCYSKKNFDNNKKNLENFFKTFKKKDEKWKFNEPKILCKQCMLKLINMPNFYENIKKIFFENEKLFKDYEIELNEAKYFNEFKTDSDEKSINSEEIDNLNIIDSNKTRKEQKRKKDSNNIIINYNNPNNNIYNTVIFNNNLTAFSLILNNYIDNLDYKDANYIESIFIKLKNEINEIINTVKFIGELYKQNQINKIDCLSQIQFLNQNINNSFVLLQSSIRNNLNYLYKLILKSGVSIYNENIVYCVVNNKNILELLNNLLFQFLYIEDIFIKVILQ